MPFHHPSCSYFKTRNTVTAIGYPVNRGNNRHRSINAIFWDFSPSPYRQYAQWEKPPWGAEPNWTRVCFALSDSLHTELVCPKPKEEKRLHLDLRWPGEELGASLRRRRPRPRSVQFLKRLRPQIRYPSPTLPSNQNFGHIARKRWQKCGY